MKLIRNLLYNKKTSLLVFTLITLTSFFSIIYVNSKESLPEREAFKNSPIHNTKYLGTNIVEAHPVILTNDKIIVESWRNSPDAKHEIKLAHISDFSEKGYENRKYSETPLNHHSLATAIVVNEALCIFAENEETERTSIDRASLKDGNWDNIQTVYENENKIFNVSITKDDEGYVILKEVSNIGVPFTMVFGKISNIMDQWTFNDKTVYGVDKYTGGPSLLYSEGWYYLFYLERFADGYATRIARSRDLMEFEESRQLFLDFDNSVVGMPGHPDIVEQNASDPEMIEENGKSVLFYTRGNQRYGGSLSLAYSDLPLEKFVLSFWEKD
ncbi:hypothetical protein [uncultured Cohaesibacter sp.]|uniref:hypothetical protein n=1 Tax=uncultured Cohaesibacter sp. TaxID=1002546 RepID=UPI0029C7AB1F|nr:hypothetical protein [uncultured Cohaesibacter sp.]